MDWLIENESTFRLSIFTTTLFVLLAWQSLAPFRTTARQYSGIRQIKRFANNLSLSFVASILLRLTPAISATFAASWVQAQSVGLLHLTDTPFFLKCLVAIILLDLGIYWQHRLSHSLPLLWRLHKVHHSDPDFDVSTALRFHPIELILSMLYKMLLVILIGAPLIAVILFEVILNASAMFNHTNITLPKGLDSILRRLVVTPDMHRVHHSPIEKETNSNYGFFLSIWDRSFSSYKEDPIHSPSTMRIGLDIDNEKYQLNSLTEMLKIPFKELPRK